MTSCAAGKLIWQLNLITEQEGLAASLIRPRHPPHSRRLRDPDEGYHKVGGVVSPINPSAQLPKTLDGRGTGKVGPAEMVRQGSSHNGDLNGMMTTKTSPAPRSKPAYAKAEKTETSVGDNVDELSKAMESSLVFVPRNVRRSARLQAQASKVKDVKGSEQAAGSGGAGRRAEGIEGGRDDAEMES